MVHGLLVHLYFRTVAIDCEMVMVEGGKNALAYCVVADEDECILLKRYIKPKDVVIFMTRVSIL